MTAPFGRLLTAMVTPFTHDGDVDLEQTKALARALIASGTEGIVATIVSGAVIAEQGQSTGNLPGRLIRGAKPAPVAH